MKGYNVKRGRWLIILTFIVALLLDILPLPGVVIWFRPQWTLLVFIYWCLALPNTIGLMTAFVLGLILDLLNGSLLGEHAFALIVVAFILIKLYQLIRVYPLFQQTILVFCLVFIYQLTIFLLQGFFSTFPSTGCYWLTLLTSTILWPWLFILLRDWRRKVLVS